MASRVRRAAVPGLAALAVAAAVAAPGCGGDNDSPAKEESPGAQQGISKQEFIAKADAICADANEKEAALRPGSLGWHYGPKFNDAEFLSRFSAVGRAAVQRLRELAPREEDANAVDAVLSSMERAVGTMEKQVAALGAGKGDRTAANVRRYERAYGDLAVSAGRFGLTQCQGIAH